MKLAAIFTLYLAAWVLLGTPSTDQKISNGKVSVTEVVIPPGETETVPGNHPSITVYSTPASFDVIQRGGKPENVSVTEGESVYAPAEPRSIQNTSGAELRFVRTEFLSTGSSETWGKTGLSPHYKLLIENRFARVYDIRIPAHTDEPQHTHRDRVVVCLSGAKLKHLYPDGHEEPSTLATGQIAWRPGGTHIGQNLGDTDLWVIAIEPK